MSRTHISPEQLNRFPSLEDLRARSKKRIPHFAWEYLDSGTGMEYGMQRNESALQAITLMPRFLKGEQHPELTTTLFGSSYRLPFGIAPVGLTGLMWPGIEQMLAATAARYQIPYCLSTVATEAPETIGPLTAGMGWFQLYPPSDPAMRRDLLERARRAGFTTLLVTIDTPVKSRRERQLRAQVSVPPRRTLQTYWRAAVRPAWAMATLRHGMPRFRALEKYTQTSDLSRVAEFMGQNMRAIDWAYLEQTCEEWQGPVLVKGIMSADDARQCLACGADGVVVSNHGARQCDGVPAAIDALPAVADALGSDGVVVFDSGIRGGLDILRALALGARFVLLGRGFIYGVTALGRYGGDHVVELLQADLESNLGNIGCVDLAALSAHISQARDIAGR